MLELQFKGESVSCLKPAMREVHNTEQTQELRLSDGMPDIGRILSAWGQIILRGKEWLSDSVNLSGGMMIWVLYMPEEETEPVCIDTWVPFQLQWDLPANTPEGDIRVECLTRFVDARSVSARKIMLRCGIAALAEAYVPVSIPVYQPEKVPEDVQLLDRTYPVRLPKEAGEKTFLLEEDLSVPASVPQPAKLVYYRMTPMVNDQRVVGDKVVFRGAGTVHLLYEIPDGQLCSWDFELPFSQFAQLNQTHSGEAEADVLLSTTSMELDMDEEGQMHLKCGLVGQYLVTDLQMLKLVEDAYSPAREMEVYREQQELPAILESRKETMNAEQPLPADANMVADTQFLPDFPRRRTMEDRIHMEMPGLFQVLYYGADGTLQSANIRWEGSMDIGCHPDSRVSVVPTGSGNPKAVSGSGAVTLKAEPVFSFVTTSEQRLPMVSGLKLGEERALDENRPSLILRRAGDVRLWDMAKSCGSTMDAIRQANAMEGEPIPGQILLIPVL